MIRLVLEHNGAVTEYADIKAAQDAIATQAATMGVPLRTEFYPRSRFGFDWAGTTLWWRVEANQPTTR